MVSLDVRKRAGENLIIASNEINRIIEEAKAEFLPSDLNVSITSDQSDQTRTQVDELQNSIILGVLLVVGVLLFFLGLRNALFVGVAIPLSMFLSFAILNALGITFNVMVLFALVLALGMLVDNGIVVVENIYRLMDEGMSPFDAARYGVGEVAWPIIASTATTLAAFLPSGDLARHHRRVHEVPADDPHHRLVLVPVHRLGHQPRADERVHAGGRSRNERARLFITTGCSLRCRGCSCWAPDGTPWATCSCSAASLACSTATSDPCHSLVPKPAASRLGERLRAPAALCPPRAPSPGCSSMA